MKVLLVNGSPNKNGSTNECLCEFQKSLKEENIDRKNDLLDKKIHEAIFSQGIWNF